MTTQIDTDAPGSDTDPGASTASAGGGAGSARRGGRLGPYLPGRREALFLIGGGALGAALGAGGVAIAGRSPASEDRIDSEELSEREGRERLEAGNARFVAGQSIHPEQSVDRRGSVATDQAPFAAVLTCADSQVPPEVIFDQGLGDLYVVRSSGQVIDHAVLGSLQYGVENLKPALLVVLGHTGCSAVAATVQVVEAEKKAAAAKGKVAGKAEAKGSAAESTAAESTAAEGAAEGHYETADEKAPSLGGAIATLITAIRPAVVEAEETGADTENLVSVSVDINVERIVEQLKASALLKEASTLRKVKIVGATYSTDSGTVNWL